MFAAAVQLVKDGNDNGVARLISDFEGDGP